MRSETITCRRLWAWLLTALFAPLAHFSGDSWLAVLLAGVICCCALALLPHYEGAVVSSKGLCLVEYIWALLLLSRFAPLSAQYWPGRGSGVVIPAVLLLLAAYANANRPSRVAGVLFWVLAAGLVPIIIAGGKDVDPRWLLPRDMDLSLLLIPALLTPFAARFLPTQHREGWGWYPWITLLGVTLCLITNGVLSHQVASADPTPFRQLSRSLTIGSASRFESLVSVLITMGWFGLYSLLLRIANVLGYKAGITITENSYVNAVVVYALSYITAISDLLLTVVTIILWVLLPFVHGKIKSKKTEKRY